MFRKTQDPPDARSRTDRSIWLASMVAGQLLGFTAAAITVAPALAPAAVLPVLFISTVFGGYLGSLAGEKLKSKPQPAKAPARTYIFEALVRTSGKLDDMVIDDDFNGAANSNDRAPKQAQKAVPRLAPAAPLPPRMGGL